MQLKHDCVRNVLLAIESAGFKEDLRFNKLRSSPYLSEYSDEDIVYTVERLKEAGYINARIEFGLQNRLMVFSVQELTWQGHQFLDNIRDANVWRETKKAVSKLAGVSLNIMANVAETIVKKMLSLD